MVSSTRFQAVAENPIKIAPSYDFAVLGNALIISMGSPHKAACSTDLSNGKTSWTFQCLK